MIAMSSADKANSIASRCDRFKPAGVGQRRQRGESVAAVAGQIRRPARPARFDAFRPAALGPCSPPAARHARDCARLRRPKDRGRNIFQKSNNRPLLGSNGNSRADDAVMLRFTAQRFTARRTTMLRLAICWIVGAGIRRNHDRRADAQPVPREIQAAVAFDEREQMAARQAGLMILDHEIQDRLAALFRRLAGAQLAPFGQIEAPRRPTPSPASDKSSSK